MRKRTGGTVAVDENDQLPAGAGGARERIMAAAFAVLTEKGYAGANTLEIATRARVSKRDIYALFGDKRGILVEMISTRAAEMRRALALPTAIDRDGIRATLVEFGGTLLHEICHPVVVALFRIAISETERDPELARVLDENGRGQQRPALIAFLETARRSSLLAAEADVERMASLFLSLLFGDVLFRVILKVVEPPTREECRQRASHAAETVLGLFPATSSA